MSHHHPSLWQPWQTLFKLRRPVYYNNIFWEKERLYPHNFCYSIFHNCSISLLLLLTSVCTKFTNWAIAYLWTYRKSTVYTVVPLSHKCYVLRPPPPPQWMPETVDHTEPYIHCFFLHIHAFSIKGSTLQLLFSISKLHHNSHAWGLLLSKIKATWT